jgi:putative membrane protein
MKRRQAGAIAAVTILLAVIASTGGTARTTAAAGESVVREVVVSKLGGDGSRISTFVSQLVLIDSEGKDVEISVPEGSDLNSYRNLSGFSGPSGEGDNLVWRSDDSLDATVLAKIDKDLPAAIDVRYYVNNKEVTADDVSGMSGDVRVEVDVENISGESTSLEHKATTSPLLTSVVNEYVPLEYIVRVTFPTNRWSRVGGEGVVVQPVDNDQVATANGVLTPPFGDAQATAVFEGTSDDILRPRIQVFATPKVSQRILDSLQQQFEALSALYGGVGTISDNLEAVYEGTLELVSGAEQLIDGVGENTNGGTGSPVVELDSAGLPTTLLGTLGFIGAAFDDQILPGVDQLAAGVADQILPGIGAVNPDTGEGYISTDEFGNTETLIGGLQSQKNAYDETLIPGMKQLIDGIDQLSEGVEGGAALVDGIGQLRDGIAQLIAQLDPTFRGGMLQVSGGLQALLGELQTNDVNNPGLREGLQAVEAGLTQMIGAMASTSPTGFTGALTGLKAIADGAAATTTDAVIAAPALAQISGGLSQLLTNLGAPGGSPLTVIGGLEQMLGGVQLMLTGVGDVANAPNQTTIIGAIESMALGMGQLLAGLGEAGKTPPSQFEIIGALELMHAGLVEAAPGASSLVDGVLGALELMRAGLTNPQFNKPQLALDGQTPKEYYQECPGCFDPDHEAFDPATANAKFQPRFLEAFTLFSEGIEAALPLLDSLDADEPGLRDGLEQVRDGLKIQLKDGLIQVADGLDELAAALHTGDKDDPGLVDGLDLVHGGLQQVNQGIFALNELGLRTLKGTVGDQGDTVGRDQAVLQDKADELATTSALGATADNVSTTYVFDSAAESTATRDNLVRGSLMALALALMAVLAHRPRVLDL